MGATVADIENICVKAYNNLVVTSKKITHLIFDLDNTLYTSKSSMDRGITKRMMGEVARFLGVTSEAAAAIRKKNIANFSTTLEWLRSLGLSDSLIEPYFKAVHPESEIDEVPRDGSIKSFIASITLPKCILTNAPSEHAQRVLKALELTPFFPTIIDIRKTHLLGKPYPKAFEVALEALGASIENTLFIDDMKKYTDGFCALGGTSVLVGPSNGAPLNEDSLPVSAQKEWQVAHKIKNFGTTHKIETIYDLKALIEKLNEEG